MSLGLLRSSTRSWSCTGAARLGWASSTKASSSSQQREAHIWAQKKEGTPPFPPLASTPAADDSTPTPADGRATALPPRHPQRPAPVFRRFHHIPKRDHATPPPPPAADPHRRGPIFRSCYINGIPESTTLAELLQAIAAAGPFGMVLSAKLTRSSNGMPGSLVEFNRAAAVDSLLRAARDGAFAVKGAKPYVLRNTVQGFWNEPRGLAASRVLRAIGAPDVEGFSEAGMRAVLMASAGVRHFLREAGPQSYWGFDSEPARESLLKDGSGRKCIEWAFFSTQYQTRPFLVALRKHFGSKLFIDFGIDPCGYSAEREQAAMKGRRPY